MSNSTSKQNRKSHSSKLTKSATAQVSSASQPNGITSTSQAPKDVENNSKLQMPAVDASRLSAAPMLACSLKPGESYDLLHLLRRLTY